VTCSVCIPTVRRPDALRRCLAALAQQIVPPDEIVVSDAGGDAETREAIESFKLRHAVSIRHCPTTRAALPWQRWWAFQNSSGSIVVFLDDDVQLSMDAIALIREAYRQGPDIAGAGFAIAYDGELVNHDESPSIRQRWLGTVGARPGSITRGGISVDFQAPNGNGRPLEVEWLSGGAMSFRREVIEAIGPQHRVFELYDAWIGKAEDSILSSRARAHGRLLLIPGRHAAHPAFDVATRTANPQDGYRKGLLETWGRAHVLRWLASDPGACQTAWVRIALLELARALKGVVQQPGQPVRWHRIAGGLVGIGRTIRRWNRIPADPGASERLRT
jgi:GT2 family glycosyltransferase